MAAVSLGVAVYVWSVFTLGFLFVPTLVMVMALTIIFVVYMAGRDDPTAPPWLPSRQVQSLPVCPRGALGKRALRTAVLVLAAIGGIYLWYGTNLSLYVRNVGKIVLWADADRCINICS